MENNFIPLSVPNLKGKELEYVTKAVETEWVSTGGPYVNDFETKLAEYVHSKGAVSCQSGTSGLHIALIITGVQAGEEVIAPALTFIAAVNPIKYIGAEPIFMDCDDTLCMDPLKLEKFCEEECEFINEKLYDKSNGKYIRTLLVVHVFGNMVDMEAIMAIASKYNLMVVEDATEALGTYYLAGKYKGKYAGTIGDIGVYSFNGNKIITTGGGGMIVSENDEYLKRAKHLTTQAKSDELYFIHDEIGYNYRMTNLQAALGLAQLEQLESFIETKIRNFQTYKNELKAVDGLKLIEFRKDIRSNHWFYSLVCSDSNIGRDKMITYLNEKNIQSRPIWGLICDQKPYKECRKYLIETARKYWMNVVNIPCSTNLQTQEVMMVVQVIKNA